MSETETELAIKSKDALYLKRALESVYSRFQSREENRGEAELDAQMIAARAIEDMSAKENEITMLKTKIEELTALLAMKPKFITEKEYKAQHAPPPPPPPPPPPVAPALSPGMLQLLAIIIDRANPRIQ